MDDVPQHKEDVEEGQPLGPDGDDKIKAHFGVGVEGGEGQEEGEVHVVHGGGGQHGAGEQIGEQAEQNAEHDTAGIEEGELGGAPLPLHEGP